MRFRTLALTVATLIAAFASEANAQDCPTKASGKRFLVEREGAAKTEIFHVDNDITRTVWRSGGRVVLETSQFQGLFQLDRIEEGRRTELLPQAALAKLFPLKTGQNVTTRFDIKESNGQNRMLTVVLSVKDSGSLFIGPCKYNILKIDRSESRSADAPRFVNTDYYSPDLKLIIAKEYKKDGKTNLIKFDRISANP